MTHSSRLLVTSGIAALALLFMAITIYLAVTAPDQVEPVQDPVISGSETPNMHQSSIEEMVDRLAARLEQQPDDVEGWVMLTNSYMTLGRHREAAEASIKLRDN